MAGVARLAVAESEDTPDPGLDRRALPVLNYYSLDRSGRIAPAHKGYQCPQLDHSLPL